MSIVTFDGKSLAADSRKSTVRIDPVTGAKEYVHQTDEQVKIELMDGTTQFRGETIEALGRCGNIRLSSTIIKTIKAGLLDIEDHWADEKVYKEFSKTASVLIVTIKNAYHFQVSSVTGLTVTVLEHKPFAMGCGKEVAVYLMTAFKLPAQAAAAAVTLTYKSCGGPIRVLKRNQFNGRLQLADTQSAATRDERRVLVADALLKVLSKMKSSAEARMVQAAADEAKVDPGIVLASLVRAVVPKKPKKRKVKEEPISHVLTARPTRKTRTLHA